MNARISCALFVLFAASLAFAQLPQGYTPNPDPTPVPLPYPIPYPLPLPLPEPLPNLPPLFPPIVTTMVQKYLPLMKGNKWTYKEEASTVEDKVEVTKGLSGQYSVQNFPGAGSGLWVKFTGSTLYGKHPVTGSWTPFLKFGAAVGTSYTVDLGTPGWTQVTVTLHSKTDSVENPVFNHTFTKCYRFGVVSSAGGPVGSVDALTFAKGVGLVKWAEMGQTQAVRWNLKTGRVAGMRVGLAPWKSLQKGSVSQYPVVGTNKSYVFYSQASWEDFYSKHAPGVPAPQVDFSKNTVVAIMAGKRPSLGYSIKVEGVKWNYLSREVTVTVKEKKPTGPMAPFPSSPYQFIVVNDLVRWAFLDWTVTTVALGGASS